MKTFRSLIKTVNSRIDDFFEKYELAPIYFILLLLAYISAFLLICVGWYAYELIVLGYLNTNEEDTFTAMKWSFLLMIPIFYFFYIRLKKKLNK